jgi:peptidyl-prolyl cis-trans isomerase D
MKSRKLIAKILTGVLFSVLILSFAVWGIGDIFRGGGQARIVAEIGDVKIDQQRYSQELSREINRLSQRFGTRLEVDQLRALGIDRQVLQQMVSRALFDQQAEDLRLLVTKAQILDRIAEEPSFQDEFGNFSRVRYFEALRVANLSEDAFTASLRGDIKRLQLVNSAIDGVAGPKKLAELIFTHQQQRRVAEYLVLANDAMADPPAPEAADLQSFYDAQAQSFMAPEYRGFTLISLEPETMAEEISVTEEELRAEFDSRREEFVVAERRSIEQMVFNEEAEAVTASERLEAGEDFTVLAEELTGQPAVVLESVEEFELLPELGAAAFRLAEDAPSAPLNSPLGWHILRVVEIEPGHEPDFVAVRDELEKDIAMRRAVDSMIELANQFDDELAGGADLSEAASALGLAQRRIDSFDRQGMDAEGNVVENLPPLEELAPVVFDTASGEDSLLTETSDGGYFAVHINRVTPAARRPLEEVRDQLLNLWRETEKVKQAEAKAAALVARLEQGETLADLAEAEGLTVATSQAITRNEADPAKTPSAAFSSRLFDLSVGEAVAVQTATGHIVAKLIEIQAAAPNEMTEEVGATRDNLGQSMRSDMLEQYLLALRRKYGVRINDRLAQEVLRGY